jgi:hypothetical protein
MAMGAQKRARSISSAAFYRAADGNRQKKRAPTNNISLLIPLMGLSVSSSTASIDDLADRARHSSHGRHSGATRTGSNPKPKLKSKPAVIPGARHVRAHSICG